MTATPITLSGKFVKPHKSVTNPDFKAKAAHVSDRFHYVEMWLRQSNREGRAAQVFWKQAANFYQANSIVDPLAKPLTSYYCMLNMTKALLVSKGKDMASVQHGVSGYSVGSKAALTNEIIKFKKSGVLAELSKFFGESVADIDKENLDNLLYNLPHIHRAYCITKPSRQNRELYIPLTNCGFFRVDGQSETYFQGDLTSSWPGGYTRSKLPKGYEINPAANYGVISIRKKKRFNWSGRSEKVKTSNLIPYHSKVRNKIHHIYDAPNYWYLKRDTNSGVADGIVNKNPTVIAFAAMHRLSELSRYDPDKLSRHFNNKYGWLLHEFLSRTLPQVLDELTSEITGREVL